MFVCLMFYIVVMFSNCFFVIFVPYQCVFRCSSLLFISQLFSLFVFFLATFLFYVFP